MELRVLRYFLEVAHTGTLTAAATKLNVTQPALSRQLKLLETELGVTLINRDHKPVSLTPEGIYLAKQAEDLIAIADKTVTNLQSKDAIAGVITIGAAETKMFNHAIKAISAMQQTYPNVTFTVISGSLTDLLDRLNQGELDFLFALDFTQKASYDYLDFPDEDVRGVFINKHHPLANESAITADQLKEYPLAILRQSSFNDSLVEELGLNASDLNIRLKYNLIGNAGMYPMIDDRIMLVGIEGVINIPELRFKPFSPKNVSVGSMIWNHTPFLSPLHEEFIRSLEDELTNTPRDMS